MPDFTVDDARRLGVKIASTWCLSLNRLNYSILPFLSSISFDNGNWWH